MSLLLMKIIFFCQMPVITYDDIYYMTPLDYLLELGFIWNTEYDIFIVRIESEDGRFRYEVHILIIPNNIFLPVTVYQLIVVDWEDRRSWIVCNQSIESTVSTHKFSSNELSGNSLVEKTISSVDPLGTHGKDNLHHAKLRSSDIVKAKI